MKFLNIINIKKFMLLVFLCFLFAWINIEHSKINKIPTTNITTTNSNDNNIIAVNDTQLIVPSSIGFPIVVDKRDGVVAQSIIQTGLWEKNISEILNKLVKKGDIVVEIGSNYGYHTISLGKIVGKKGKVYGYEANKDLCRNILNKNIVLNDLTDNVIISCTAVSDQEQTNVKFFTGFSNLGGSFIAGKNFNLTNFNQNELYKDWEAKTVNTITLDQDLKYLKNIDILRMDSEGSELAIINGAYNLISSSKDIKIIMEWSTAMLSNFGNVETLLNKLESDSFNFYLINHNGTLTKKTKSEMLVLPHCDVVIARNNIEF